MHRCGLCLCLTLCLRLIRIPFFLWQCQVSRVHLIQDGFIFVALRHKAAFPKVTFAGVRVSSSVSFPRMHFYSAPSMAFSEVMRVFPLMHIHIWASFTSARTSCDLYVVLILEVSPSEKSLSLPSWHALRHSGFNSHTCYSGTLTKKYLRMTEAGEILDFGFNTKTDSEKTTQVLRLAPHTVDWALR